MRILITGAGSNIGKGMAARLRAVGHDLVLSDVNRLPDAEPFTGLPFVQADIQQGFGLERAISGCDLLLHLPAWHGIHGGQKTEVDYWRLNVDGTFYALQAAKEAGTKRCVFLSSTAWYGHYDKYGFTKRVGEELIEYHRRNHGLRSVIVRPNDLTPWGGDWVNRYGARLLYGGVDREDVLDCVARSVAYLEGDAPENVVVHAVRHDPYEASQLDGWEDDPSAACERIFPGAAELIARYGIAIGRKPTVSRVCEGAAAIGYAPSRHFGTFLDELRVLDPEEVRRRSCAY